MSAESPRPRPRPQPGPRPNDGPLNYVTDRRKVVLGLGFGAASIAGLRSMGFEDDDTDGTAVETAAADGTGDAADDGTRVTGEPEPFDPPVFDASARLADGQTADVVLTGGRIIDPATGFDRVGNVALVGGVIAEISEGTIPATRTVDVSGQVVSPGFIDILSYAPNGYGEWWKVADGVTSNMCMHGIRLNQLADFAEWTGTKAGGTPVHFGGAVHNSEARLRSQQLEPGVGADGAQIDQIATAIADSIRGGFIGIHAQPEYAPGVGPDEMLDMGTIAAQLGVPLCVHARYSENQAPGTQSEAVDELVSVARNTGAHVHIEHLNSTGGTGRMLEALAQIEAARDEGLRVTACMYPYEFWATGLKTSRFQGWQEKYGLTYGDLQVAGQSERLTEETFQAAYDANALTAAFAIPAEDLVAGFGASFMMIGSDAILERPHNNHPRSTGCFSRVLGHFVREQNVLSLNDALAMMTIRSADFLAQGAPAMRSKGRMQIGADADVTVFDPATIIDNSTIANPAQESTGVAYVYVSGVEVRTAGVNNQTQFPGVSIEYGIA